MDKKEYYSPFEWTTDILFTTAIFKLCNFFRYPKGQKFHAYGQRVDLYGMVTDALLNLDFKHSKWSSNKGQ